MDAQNFFSWVLSKLAGELSVVTANTFWNDSFVRYCRFVKWCLTDPDCGALRAVQSTEVRQAIQRVVALCEDQCKDCEAWKDVQDVIMPLAMDLSGAEARAADAAYGFARVVGDADPNYADAALRKLLRITDRNSVAQQLSELIG